MGGRDGKFGMDMYTLLYLKWITNKDRGGKTFFNHTLLLTSPNQTLASNSAAHLVVLTPRPCSQDQPEPFFASPSEFLSRTVKATPNVL